MIDNEIFEQIHNLVTEWVPKENNNVPADVITQIFNLHNKVFMDRPEYSTACGGCRQRVWNKLKTFYYENKQNYGY
jgi:hypothetical protein